MTTLAVERERAQASDRGVMDPRTPAVPRHVRWSILIVLALIGLSRSPYVFTHGRFWAEEGVLHFRNMVVQPFPADILYVQTRTGYYNLFADGSTWLASNVSLTYAPLVTVWLSFGVVLVLAWVALAWPSDLLPNAGAKVAAAVLMVVGTLALSEVWVNSINAQTYLALLTVLLLFARVGELGPSRYGIGIALLLLAGLSGLYSVALAPLFIVCTMRDRTVRRWGFAAVLTAAGLVQVAVYVRSRSTGHVAGSKVGVPPLDAIYRSITGWQVGGLLLPQPTTGRLVSHARHATDNSGLVLGILAVLFFGLLGLLLWRVPNRRVTVLLAGALLITEGLVQLGALGVEAGGRYAVVPVGILTLMLIHGAATASGRVLPWAGVAVLGVVLGVGLSQFWTERPTRLQCIDCPNWANEVKAFQEDPTDQLQIWPYDAKKPWVFVVPLADDSHVEDREALGPADPSATDADASASTERHAEPPPDGCVVVGALGGSGP